MGCGASICNKLRAGSDHAAPLLASDHQRGLVTPPGSRRTSRQAPIVANGKAFGLKIDTGMTTREKAGLAETPMGKAADEYKYYCPLCMMFFRNILDAYPPPRTPTEGLNASTRVQRFIECCPAPSTSSTCLGHPSTV